MALTHPLIAIVGRPNVGKSTLFNRLIGERKAVVATQRGTTRDRVYGQAQWRGRTVTLIDTGGVEFGRHQDLAAAVQRHVARALEEAEGVIFVCDAQEGVVPADQMIAERLRTTGKPVLLAVNKADQRPVVPPEFYALGVSPVLAVSALHGLGSGELLDALLERLAGGAPAPAQPTAYAIAILGRPNVGKSSLLNTLLKEERAIVSDAPGTTRDAIDACLRVNGESVVLVDTAGMKPRRKVKTPVEFFSMARSFDALARCDIALIVLDATEPMTRDDRRLVARVCEAGKPFILLANKWDLVRRGSEQGLKATTYRQIPFASFAPILPISAKTGAHVERILPLARRIVLSARRGLTDTEGLALVQRLWRAAHPAPRIRGRFASPTQARWVAGAPPRIALTIKPSGALPRAFLHALTNQLYAATPKLTGIPVRVVVAGGKGRP